MRDINKVFLAISGLFGTIPGLAIMVQGLAAPKGYTLVFAGGVEAFGALGLLLLWMNKSRLKAAAPAKIIRWSVSLAAASFLCIGVYVALYAYCVYGNDTKSPIVIPMWTTGKLDTLIQDAGGRRSDAVREHQTGGLEPYIGDNPLALAVTVGVMLFFYQAIFTCLSLAFGLIGFHKGLRLGDPGSKAADPPDSATNPAIETPEEPTETNQPSPDIAESDQTPSEG